MIYEPHFFDLTGFQSRGSGSYETHSIGSEGEDDYASLRTIREVFPWLRRGPSEGLAHG